MGLNVYEIKSRSVPETQDAQDQLYERKVASGEWSEDVLLSIEMPKLEKERVEDAVEEMNQGKEWCLGFSQVDMHDSMDLPLVYEAYIDYLETIKLDFLGENIMTKKMLDIIMSKTSQSTSYSVSILERQRIKDLSASKIEGISDGDVDELVRQFKQTAETRYHYLHLLTQIDLFDPKKSDRSERRYVLNAGQPVPPPFFRVTWGPRSALLCTDEGRAHLEPQGLLGLHFELLNIEEQAQA